MGMPKKARKEQEFAGDWMYARFPDGRVFKIPVEYIQKQARELYPDMLCDVLTAASLLRWEHVRNRAIQVPSSLMDDSAGWGMAMMEIK